jgi:hypothetical protein
MTRSIVFSGFVAMSLLGTLTAASATECEMLAGNCEYNRGGPDCRSPARIADCERTGVYTSPGGRQWLARGRSSNEAPQRIR